MTNVVIPCAKENGMTDTDLAALYMGDLSRVKNLYGCFADCLSKKTGMLSDDNVFKPEGFQKLLSRYVKDDYVKEFMEKCAHRVGTGECNITGRIHECFVEHIFTWTYWIE